MLLSPSSAQYLLTAVRMCCWIGATPYKWDNQTKKFYFDNSRCMRMIWWLHNIVYNSYMFFVFLRWVEHAMVSVKSPGAMGSLYVVLNYQIANAVQISVYYSYGSHHKWLNMFFEYIEDLQHSQGKHLRTSKLVSNDCSGLLRIFYSSCVIIFILDTYSVFLTPHSPFFYSSLLPEPEKQSWYVILPFAIFHDYIWIYQWFVVLFFYCSIVSYLTGVQNALDALRCTIVLNETDRKLKTPKLPPKVVLERYRHARVSSNNLADSKILNPDDENPKNNRKQGQISDSASKHDSNGHKSCADTHDEDFEEVLRELEKMQVVEKVENLSQRKITEEQGLEEIRLLEHSPLHDAGSVKKPENSGIVFGKKRVERRPRKNSTPILIGLDPMAFSRQYRTLEILQGFCNTIWGDCNAFYEIAFICGSVLGFYNAVTLERDRAFHQFSVGVFFTYTLMMIWQLMGSTFEQSSEILWSWNPGKVGRPLFRKFLQSARPIRTNIGGFFYADRGIRLTILTIILERTSSLLLSR